MVSLNLCKEYLNVLNYFKIPVLSWMKNWIFWYTYRSSFYAIIYRSYKLLNLVRFFFGPLCIMTFLFETTLDKNVVHNILNILHWLSFVDDFKSFGDFIKRRSLCWFLRPTLFHKRQDVWMHAGRLFRGKWRSIERSASTFDFLHDCYIIHSTNTITVLWAWWLR